MSWDRTGIPDTHRGLANSILLSDIDPITVLLEGFNGNDAGNSMRVESEAHASYFVMVEGHHCSSIGVHGERFFNFADI